METDYQDADEGLDDEELAVAERDVTQAQQLSPRGAAVATPNTSMPDDGENFEQKTLLERVLARTSRSR